VYIPTYSGLPLTRVCVRESAPHVSMCARVRAGVCACVCVRACVRVCQCVVNVLYVLCVRV